MRIALVVPGGVDRSGTHRVIPALLALIERLTHEHHVEVIALNQEARAASWNLLGARITNIGLVDSRRNALRAIITMHRERPFDVIHAIWSGTTGMLAVIAARYLGIPSMIHVAGGELVALRDIGYGGAQRWRGRCREFLVLRAATVVTAASGPVIDSLAKLGVAARRVPLGVARQSWPLREPVRRTRGAIARLLHVASLNAVKDQTTLMHALAHLKHGRLDFELDVVGVDTLHGAVQRLVGRLGIGERVRFRGFLPQVELRPLVEAAHVLVMSSRHETGPLVLLEAAMAGVPTVGTAVGHIAEFAPDAALAVPPQDWLGLAGATASLLQDEDFRLSVARAAYLRASREDADFTAREFSSVYRELAPSTPTATVNVCRK